MSEIRYIRGYGAQLNTRGRPCVALSKVRDVWIAITVLTDLAHAQGRTRGPTVREIAAYAGLRSLSTCQNAIVALERSYGYISRSDDARSRSIQLLDRPDRQRY